MRKEAAGPARENQYIEIQVRTVEQDRDIWSTIRERERTTDLHHHPMDNCPSKGRASHRSTIIIQRGSLRDYTRGSEVGYCVVQNSHFPS